MDVGSSAMFSIGAGRGNREYRVVQLVQGSPSLPSILEVY